MTSGHEIERKFKISDVSFLGSGHTPTRIEQVYLYIGEDCEVRVRCVEGQQFSITMKGPPFLTRIEQEHAIEEVELATALMAGDLPRIEKDRYSVAINEYSFYEIDVFHGANDGLIIAEVELHPTTNTLTIPDWIESEHEVTNKPQYYNASLATRPWSSWSSEERQP
jgi:CYTH domain-containing protein